MILGLEPLDFIVVLIYMGGIAYIGLRTYRMIKTSGDFFLGGRRFGRILMMFQSFGAGTSADQPIAVAGASYQRGISGIWIQFLYLIVTPFYWLFPPVYRRLRTATTTGDFFRERYHHSLEVAYTIFALLFIMLDIGLQLKGCAFTLDSVTEGAIPTNHAIILMTLIFLAYSMVGGLVATAHTALAQGFLIVIFSFLLMPFAIAKAGGFAALHAKLDPSMFSLVAKEEITLFFIIIFIINGLVGIVTQPHVLALCASGKKEIQGRIGFCYGNFIKRFCTIAWAFTGVTCAALYTVTQYPILAEHREMVFGMAIRDLLPVGLTGLMLAAMMAAAMSTTGAMTVVGSALFTHNVYKRYMQKSLGDEGSLKVGRWLAVVIVGGGVFFAYAMPTVLQGIIWFMNAAAVLGVSWWLGVIWRRANTGGAWTSIILATSAFVTAKIVFPGDNAWQMTALLVAGFIGMIVGTILSKPERKEKLDRFFTMLRTPVGEEYKLREAGIEFE